MNYVPDDERPDIVHFKCPLSGLEISLVAANYPPNSMNACVMVYIGRNPRPFIVPVDAVVDVWNRYSRWMDTQEEKGGEEDSNFWNEQLGNLNFEGGADDKH